MNGSQTMTSAEGAAIRVQLDGLINSLHAADQRAGAAGDEDVLRLLACLYGAREAASAVEMRPAAVTEEEEEEEEVHLSWFG
jgi:hypothetical protein